jgi:hypothetical protein
VNRSEYYKEMQALARDTRAVYGLTSPRVMKSDLRRIFKDQGVRVDIWSPKMRQLRGAYFNDDAGPKLLCCLVDCR